MKKILAVIAVAALLFIIGSAGALESSMISVGQAIIQMIAGVAVFAVSTNALIKSENAACR